MPSDFLFLNLIVYIKNNRYKEIFRTTYSNMIFRE